MPTSPIPCFVEEGRIPHQSSPAVSKHILTSAARGGIYLHCCRRALSTPVGAPDWIFLPLPAFCLSQTIQIYFMMCLCLSHLLSFLISWTDKFANAWGGWVVQVYKCHYCWRTHLVLLFTPPCFIKCEQLFGILYYSDKTLSNNYYVNKLFREYKSIVLKMCL
jgi:hypothetical protein